MSIASLIKGGDASVLEVVPAVTSALGAPMSYMVLSDGGQKDLCP